MPRIKKSVREIKNRIIEQMLEHLTSMRGNEIKRVEPLVGADSSEVKDIKQAYAIIQNALERRRSD